MREHLEQHSHSAALDIPDPRCLCLARYQIPRLPRNHLHCHLDYPSPHSSYANLRCPKCFQVCYPHHVGLWWWIQLIWPTFNIWVRPPGRSFADKAGGKGNLSNNSNAAAPSYRESDQDALTISSLSEMYPTAVICLFWVWDFFWVVHRFWLPCHISKKSWTLAALCNFLSSGCFFISESYSAFVISNAGSAPT